MTIALTILGGLMDLMGTVWSLQGVGILPGSFMTGQPEWAVYGAIMVAAGIALIVFANRRRRVP